MSSYRRLNHNNINNNTDQQSGAGNMVLPAENGRRRAYPTLNQMRRSTLDEMEWIREGAAQTLGRGLRRDHNGQGQGGGFLPTNNSPAGPSSRNNASRRRPFNEAGFFANESHRTSPPQQQQQQHGRGGLMGGTARPTYGADADGNNDDGQPFFSQQQQQQRQQQAPQTPSPQKFRRSLPGLDSSDQYDYDSDEFKEQLDSNNDLRVSWGNIIPQGGTDGSNNNGNTGSGRFQGYLNSLIKLLALITMLSWLSGYVLSPYSKRSVTSMLASPLELVGALIPGLSTHTSRILHGGNTLRSSELLDGVASDGSTVEDEKELGPRPDFVYEHPYVSSSYYTSTKSISTLISTEEGQVLRNLRREAEEAVGLYTDHNHGDRDDINGEHDNEHHKQQRTRLAIVRPFCEFDAEALPTTFTCWNALPPCKAASADIGEADFDEDEDEDLYEVGPNGHLVSYNKNTTAGQSLYERHSFDLVGSDAMKNAKADVFLFYSQTFSENDVAIKAVDTIIDQFFEPGGWSQCFDNIYAIEANIPQELDLYIPSAQEELYNWVNGPNRQFEAAFRIIQSGEWGEYDGFYLMEGDSVPIKAHWLDVVLSEIEVNRPFAILGAQYDGDKWDNFYEKIPISLLHHTNGNAIYNTSHPLLERLVGQLEVEAPCPYNSIPYDYRMSQMWVEGTLGIVPELAPKIMLNEEGENITLSSNVDMFNKWADIWEKEDPFKYTPVIHNYAATNLIPRHLGPEYIIHGAKLYSPWNPTKTDVTLVVSEWFFDRSLHLIQNLDEKDHPFSEVVVMVPPVAGAHDDYDELSDVPVRTQHRGAPDFMDLCEADVKTDWFMITNSYHHVARHVDLMFTPGSFKPVIPFTPATYPFCFKFPYCKETINLAQRINPGHDKVVLDMDMLYNTKARDDFCKEWKETNGEEGEDLYKHQQRRLMFRKKVIGPPGPTGTSYFAWLVKNAKDGMYKMTDRSLYGARPPFVKIFSKEEKLDGMSEDELAKRVGMTLLDNSTDCNCGAYETELDCGASGIGCIWRPLFESCHPPELVDGGEPICSTTEAPTMSPTLPLPLDDTEAPTSSPSTQGTLAEDDPWYSSLFKSREHEGSTTEADNSTVAEDTLVTDDDDAILEPDATGRKLKTDALDSLYETDLSADHRHRKLQADSLDSLYERELSTPGRKLQAESLDSLELNTPGRSLQVDSLDSLYETGLKTPGKKPSIRGRKLEADTHEPWYETNLRAEQRLDAALASADDDDDGIDAPDLGWKPDPWEETKLSADQPKDISSEPNYDLLEAPDLMETMTLEQMLAEELKLEAVLEKQEAAKKRKADAISKLTNKELFYQSEILKLEEQLEKFEAKQDAHPSPNGNTFGQDIDEDIEF